MANQEPRWRAVPSIIDYRLSMTGEDQIASDQLTALEGAVNLRDLGGYPSSDGRAVRRGRLFRSGTLSALTDTDLAALEQARVRTVIDLRLPSQIEMFGPDRIPHGVQHLSLPMGGGDVSEVVHEAIRSGRFASLPDVETVNRAILSEDRHNLTEVIRVVAEPERLPLIFHCIGGKDRTGVVAALLLSLLGVPWAMVREDYVRSNEHVAEAIDAQLADLAHAAAARTGRQPAPVDLEAAKRFSMVEENDLDAVRDEMIGDAGSIELYLHDKLGISDETVQCLRDELLE